MTGDADDDADDDDPNDGDDDDDGQTLPLWLVATLSVNF